MLFRRTLILLLVAHVVAHAAAFAQPEANQGAPQGWTRSEREIFWHSPVGSHLVPYPWFLGLEQTASQDMFAAPENLARYGFIPAAATPTNPDGLPIGLARERDRAAGSTDRLWLGLGCAACHVRGIAHAGQTILVDGAGAMLDAAAFTRDLAAARAATAADDARFTRFADRLAIPEPDRPALRARLAAPATPRDALPPDPGRFDLLGTLVDATAATLGHPEDIRPLVAPIRMPRLWGAPGYDRALSAALPNAGLGPLLRNIDHVLATGGTVDLATSPYTGSTSLFDLEKLEALLRRLQPPAWPGIFPPIDQARAAAGAATFARTCAGCHVPAARDRDGLLTLAMLPAAPSPLSRPIETGPLADRPAGFVGGAALPATAPALTVTAHIAIGIAAQLPRERFTAGLRRYMEFPMARAALRATPLAGIWANAPYLHNGSVPNLQQLLTPPAERAASFSLAPAEYDPATVGLPLDTDAATPRFDTSLPGNGNTGHEYGTALDPVEKQNLIEFLKTL